MPPPQLYGDGYNYAQSYVPPAQAYAPYDYSMQAQPPFNAYGNQAMQPVPPGKLHSTNVRETFGFANRYHLTGDDFQQSSWVHPTHMALPPPALIIPPPIQQVAVETEEEKLKREG